MNEESKIKSFIIDGGNSKDFIDFIYREKINLNKEYYSIGNPLVLALMKGSADSVMTLMEAGADMFYVSVSDGMPTYNNIIFNNREDVVDLLLPDFWIDYFSDFLNLCVKTKNTKILVKILNKIAEKTNNLELLTEDILNFKSMMFYAALRNEIESMKLFLKFGASVYFDFNGVNIISVLSKNLFTPSYEYISEKYPDIIAGEDHSVEEIDIDAFFSYYKRNRSIDDISFMIARYGGKILLCENSEGVMLIETIIESKQPAFFFRMFKIMNDRSEYVINKLVEKAKKEDQKKIMEILIEESVR